MKVLNIIFYILLSVIIVGGMIYKSNNPTQYEHGFPRQFHELLARRVAIAYKSSKDRPIPLSEKEQMYEIDLERQIVLMRDENMDRNIIPSIPYNDGSNY